MENQENKNLTEAELERYNQLMIAAINKVGQEAVLRIRRETQEKLRQLNNSNHPPQLCA